jgi:hypothetical protein
MLRDRFPWGVQVARKTTASGCGGYACQQLILQQRASIVHCQFPSALLQSRSFNHWPSASKAAWVFTQSSTKVSAVLAESPLLASTSTSRSFSAINFVPRKDNFSRNDWAITANRAISLRSSALFKSTPDMCTEMTEAQAANSSTCFGTRAEIKKFRLIPAVLRYTAMVIANPIRPETVPTQPTKAEISADIHQE